MEHPVPHVKTLGSPQYKSRTTAKGIAPEDQLDVYERAVDWSAVKQLRSVLETTDFSCDDVFDCLVTTVDRTLINERSSNKAPGTFSSGQHLMRIVESEGEDRLTYITYREIPLPWPFT